MLRFIPSLWRDEKKKSILATFVLYYCAGSSRLHDPVVYFLKKNVSLHHRNMIGYSTRLTLVKGPHISDAPNRVVELPSGALVRRLESKPCLASELHSSSEAILLNSCGSIVEPDLLLYEFEQRGTTAVMVVAEAWKLSSKAYKETLLQKLLDSKEGELLDMLVLLWNKRKSRRSPTGEVKSDSVGATSSRNFPYLRKEAFDVCAAAFLTFADDPKLFRMSQGGRHEELVNSLIDAFRSAFESEIQGPWSASAGASWILSAEVTMPSETVMKLLRECCAALVVRDARNSNVGHPFRGPNAVMRESIFRLYETAVSIDLPLLRGFPTLAKAAITHVRRDLEETIAKEEIEMREEDGDPDLQDLLCLVNFDNKPK